MSINCEIVVRDRATADELRALGRALWSWYSRSWGDAVLCQTVDNQGLADLLGGNLPALRRTPRFAGRRYVHLRVPDEAAAGAQATVDRLRQELGAERVEEIWVDGNRWESRPGRPGPAPVSPPVTSPTEVQP